MFDRSHERTEVEVEIIQINPDSVVVTDGRTRAVLPKSQIEEKDELVKGDTLTIHIPEWLAEDRGLI